MIEQIIQGFGGGFAAVASQVGAQASVPHAEVAIVTAMVLLVTEIGGAIGTAIGTSDRKHPANHYAHCLELYQISWWNLDVSISPAYPQMHTNVNPKSSNTMPKQLEIHLPGVNATTRDTLFGSITSIAAYPPGDPIREGVIQGALL